MELLVLGSGCPKCRKLAEVTDQAARELALDYQLSKVTDLNRILAFRILRTPALVVDGTVQVTGRVPSVEELKRMLVAARSQPSAT